MVLSHDFTGYDGSNTVQQFNFNIADVEAVIKRKLVNEEKFFVYLERMKTTVEVQFFTSNNGGAIGDGYGRFVDPTPYTGSTHFYPGDWIVFSNNLAKTLTDFKLGKYNYKLFYIQN